ncbi:hypothetical protein [Hyalangium sp.]|uniref:hypothetical protein n=1 Tax=Hyalangium sp. TaxID=2028555 RepID=UPI002D6CD37C|nr:hypothetical protein [Hyalangium sp.]HYH98780.1 hypothetical protein [Hyalangium sp.]
MDIQQEAIDMLRKLREQGVPLERALDEMKMKKYGLIPVVKAIRAVEGLSYAEAVDTIERRGDYDQF